MTIDDADRRPFPRWQVRVLEIAPAALTWTILLLPFILSFAAPGAIAYFIILFNLWWLFRSVYFSYALITAYLRLRRDADKPWMRMLEASDLPWRKLLHVVVYPFYNEDEEVLVGSIEAMAATDYPRDRIVLVIAAEERGGPAAETKARMLEARFRDRFAAVLVSMHPDGVVGEVKGKAPNITHAMKRFEAEVLPGFGTDPADVIVHSIDSDSVFHPQHFAHTSHAVLAHARPDHALFQFLPLYHNNAWEVPALTRLVANSTTFWLMLESTRPWRLRCHAVYAMTLTSLRAARYWDNTSIIEDGMQYWRHFLAYSGDMEVVAVYSPVYMDAVLGSSYLGTLKAQYTQLRRWAWGASDLSFVLPAFLRSPEIPRSLRILEIVRLVESHLSWATAPLLLVFLGWLPTLNHAFLQTTLGYNLVRTAGTLLTLALIGVVVAVAITLLLQPRPKQPLTFGQRISFLAQFVLIPVMTIFMSIPAIHSQTNLALGRYMGSFVVTEKKRQSVV